jgi:transcriptional regulator with XRE-family HTH domain
MTIDELLSTRVRALRKQRGYTLEELAQRSSVSRSMISLIERGQTSATAAVLGKLAQALQVPLAALFADERQTRAPQPLARADAQPCWRDPATGYERRQLSPVGFPAPFEMLEVVFPPDQRVAFDNGLRSQALHQQLWLLQGELQLTLGTESWHLRAGDCLAMVLDQTLVFSNPGREPARYLLVLAAPGGSLPPLPVVFPGETDD